MSCLSGFAGGSHYEQPGGGSNHLCLRSDPIFRPNDEARGSSPAEVYGAECRDPSKSQLNEQEVPCAVCQVTRRSVLIMTGTNLCDVSWSTEYVGYIAAERIYGDRYRSQFICVSNCMTVSDCIQHRLFACLYHVYPMWKIRTYSVWSYLADIPAQTLCGSLPCLPDTQHRLSAGLYHVYLISRTDYLWVSTMLT